MPSSRNESLSSWRVETPGDGHACSSRLISVWSLTTTKGLPITLVRKKPPYFLNLQAHDLHQTSNNIARF